MPARIAKGELEGKMKARIWRKLHREEAARFDQVYALMEKHPGLDLADGFGIVQSGLSLDACMTRKARSAKKAEVKQARSSVPNQLVDDFLQKVIDEKAELSVVLGERSLLDVLTQTAPVSFTFARQGRLEKLQVVLMSRKPEWDAVGTTLPRDPKLAQKPAPIIRQPDKRAVADPRPFLELAGQRVELHLRNGIIFTETLIGAGAFDLLLGTPGHEWFVPLHALVKWAKV